MKTYIYLGLFIASIVGMIAFLRSGFPAGENGWGYPLTKEEAAARIAAVDLSRGPFTGLQVTTRADSDWVHFVADSPNGPVLLCEARIKPAASRVVMDSTCQRGSGEFAVDSASHDLMLTAFGELVDAALTGRQFDSEKVDTAGASMAFYKMMQGEVFETQRLNDEMEAQADYRDGDWGSATIEQ